MEDMPMWRLKVCLWIVAAGCLAAGLTLFLPLSTYNSLAKMVASTELPSDATFVYALRALSATYLGIGVFFILLALHPRRYDIMVPFAGIAAAFVGLVCLVIGLIHGLPTTWFVGDASFGILLGLLIVQLWRDSYQEDRNDSADAKTDEDS